MQIVGGLNVASPPMSGQRELTPELEAVLCLSWIKHRLNNSKVDGVSRIGAVFSDIDNLTSLSRASLRCLDARNIESTARQLSLETSLIADANPTADFSVLARAANDHPQTPCLIIVGTDKGHVFPVVAYKSGGKIKGLGSHLYVFSPLCGELKLQPKTASQVLRNCVSLTQDEGRPERYDAFTVKSYHAPAGVEHIDANDGAIGGFDNVVYGAVDVAPSRPAPPPKPPRPYPVKPPVPPKPPGLGL